jgi:hypothetical protein
MSHPSTEIPNNRFLDLEKAASKFSAEAEETNKASLMKVENSHETYDRCFAGWDESCVRQR